MTTFQVQMKTRRGWIPCKFTNDAAVAATTLSICRANGKRARIVTSGKVAA